LRASGLDGARRMIQDLPALSGPPARGNTVLASQLPARPTEPRRHPSRLPSSRAAIAASILLLCSVGLGACGGGSSVSDTVPKSTPDITPPTDTSAEKAAVQTTSTSTTSTAKSSEGTSTGSGEESSSSEEAASSGGSESGASESNGESAGGTSAGGTAKTGGEAAKETPKESAATPSGGASAP
jgi:hypothetical protein